MLETCELIDGIDGVYPWFFMAIFGLGDCKVAYIFFWVHVVWIALLFPFLKTNPPDEKRAFAPCVCCCCCFFFMHLQWRLLTAMPSTCPMCLAFGSIRLDSALLCSVLFCSVLFWLGRIFQKVLGRLAVGVRHPRHPTPHPLVILPWLMMRSVVIRSKRGKSAAEAELSNGLNPSFLFISLWAVLLC